MSVTTGDGLVSSFCSTLGTPEVMVVPIFVVIQGKPGDEVVYLLFIVHQGKPGIGLVLVPPPIYSTLGTQRR